MHAVGYDTGVESGGQVPPEVRHPWRRPLGVLIAGLLLLAVMAAVLANTIRQEFDEPVGVSCIVTAQGEAFRRNIAPDLEADWLPGGRVGDGYHRSSGCLPMDQQVGAPG